MSDIIRKGNTNPQVARIVLDIAQTRASWLAAFHRSSEVVAVAV